MANVAENGSFPRSGKTGKPRDYGQGARKVICARFGIDQPRLLLPVLFPGAPFRGKLIIKDRAEDRRC